MKLLVPGEERLPAHAESEVEPWMRLEFILAVKKVLPSDRVTAGLAEDNAHRIERAEQKVGIGVSGPGPSESGAAGLGELVVQDPVHVVHLVTPLERVAASDPAHRIAKMPVLVFLLVRVHGAEIEPSL